MHQAALVGGLQPQRRLPNQLAHLRHGQPALALHQPTQRRTVEVLRHQVGAFGVGAGVVSADNVIAVQAAQRLHLAAEAGQQQVAVEADVRLRPFDSAKVLESQVVGQVDDPQAARRQFVLNFQAGHRAGRRRLGIGGGLSEGGRRPLGRRLSRGADLGGGGDLDDRPAFGARHFFGGRVSDLK